MPFYKITLNAEMPPPRGMPTALDSVGDHIRAARITRGMEQKDLAGMLGVTKDTIANWEMKRTSPNILQCGKVIEFLGYDPFPAPVTFAERLLSFRRSRGLRVRDAAQMAGVDPSSWTGWENDGHSITAACREKILRILNS